MASSPDPRIVRLTKPKRRRLPVAKTYWASFEEIKPYLKGVRPPRLPKNPVVRKKKDEPRA